MNVTETQIRTMLVTLFKSRPNEIEQWFDKSLPSLNMRTPREAIDACEGSQVVAMLTRFLPNGKPNDRNHVPDNENETNELPIQKD